MIWVIGTRSEPHHIKVAFPTAFNLKSGLDVQVDGLDAGKISKVEYKDGRSIVELGISDDYWPLPKGTTASTRYGTTIGSGTRRVDLKLGPTNAGSIPEDGIIAAKDTRPAVDVDAVLNTASAATRRDATNLTSRIEQATEGTESEANASLAASGQGLKDIDGFLKDLGSDGVALSGLITNTDRLTQTLASRAPAVSDLVTVSARTFEAFASRTSELQQTLDGVQPAMSEARTTLARVDGSLGGLTQLVDDIRPGAKRLKPLAKAATPALRNLSSIVPTALSTVRTTTKVAPELNTLLTNGQPFLQKTSRVLKELTPMVHCVAPYAPELGGALVAQTGGYQEYFLATDDNPAFAKLNDAPPPWRERKENGRHRVHDLRARINGSTATLHAYPPGLLTVDQFVKIGLKQYAFMRPPGLGAGQPYYLPECGITKDSLDPSKDPEEKWNR
ncbi:MlaD family protein [Patulibacter sp. NPDC049589]|uniref:MlaD family protein n=1 Tax=Patulibacter sp. NPDC049589 TaxID=3154731 RepID=UPI00342E7CA2